MIIGQFKAAVERITRNSSRIPDYYYQRYGRLYSCVCS
jgi:hypothetical protein